MGDYSSHVLPLPIEPFPIFTSDCHFCFAEDQFGVSTMGRIRSMKGIPASFVRRLKRKLMKKLYECQSVCARRDIGDKDPVILTYKEAHALAMRRVSWYCESYPEIDCLDSKKALYDECYSFYEEHFAAKRLERLLAQLNYRFEQSQLATKYKNLLQLHFIDCDQFDADAWMDELDRRVYDTLVVARFTYALREIVRTKLFEPPQENEGCEWDQPWVYLCAILAVQQPLPNQSSSEQISGTIARLEALKLEHDNLQTHRPESPQETQERNPFILRAGSRFPNLSETTAVHSSL